MVETVSVVQLAFGLLAIGLSLGVIAARNPIVSAMCLMGTLFSTAFLYLAMGAMFAGVVQILVYAGAIAVLFVFIVMLLDLRAGKILLPGTPGKVFLAAAAVGLFLGLAAGSMTLLWSSGPGYSSEAQGFLLESLSAKAISQDFLSTHMLPFQATGFLILACIVGVVMLARSVKKTFEGETSK